MQGNCCVPFLFNKRSNSSRTHQLLGPASSSVSGSHNQMSISASFLQWPDNIDVQHFDTESCRSATAFVSSPVACKSVATICPNCLRKKLLRMPFLLGRNFNRLYRLLSLSGRHSSLFLMISILLTRPLSSYLSLYDISQFFLMELWPDIRLVLTCKPAFHHLQDRLFTLRRVANKISQN
jgi:hypothetical protein